MEGRFQLGGMTLRRPNTKCEKPIEDKGCTPNQFVQCIVQNCAKVLANRLKVFRDDIISQSERLRAWETHHRQRAAGL